MILSIVIPNNPMKHEINARLRRRRFLTVFGIISFNDAPPKQKTQRNSLGNWLSQ